MRKLQQEQSFNVVVGKIVAVAVKVAAAVVVILIALTIKLYVST